MSEDEAPIAVIAEQNPDWDNEGLEGNLLDTENWDDEPEEQPETKSEPNPKYVSKSTKKKEQEKQRRLLSEPTKVGPKSQEDKIKEEKLSIENEMAAFSEMVTTEEPQGLKEYETLGNKIAEQILVHEESEFYLHLLKALFKTSVAPLDVDEIRDLQTVFEIIASKKIQEEKGKTRKKKTGPKAQVTVDKKIETNDVFNLDTTDVRNHGQFEEGDFM